MLEQQYAFDKHGNSIRTEPEEDRIKSELKILQPIIDWDVGLMDAALLYKKCNGNIRDAVMFAALASVGYKNPLDLFEYDEMVEGLFECVRLRIAGYNQKSE